MKQLLLIRHAKSSWESADITDFDRPLNERGKKDAPIMAKRLYDRGITIDLFVSSPAKRARKTAELFATAYEYPKKDIIFFPGLYEPTTEAFYEAVAGLENKYETVAMFSHNPGITLFAAGLTNVAIDDMPTCAVFGVKCKAKQWEQFREKEKTFWLFDFPKADHSA